MKEYYLTPVGAHAWVYDRFPNYEITPYQFATEHKLISCGPAQKECVYHSDEVMAENYQFTNGAPHYTLFKVVNEQFNIKHGLKFCVIMYYAKDVRKHTESR